jgi:hypothetical protein
VGTCLCEHLIARMATWASQDKCGMVFEKFPEFRDGNIRAVVALVRAVATVGRGRLPACSEFPKIAASSPTRSPRRGSQGMSFRPPRSRRDFDEAAGHQGSMACRRPWASRWWGPAKGVTAIATGLPPTRIGGPAVRVLRVIGVTVRR